MFDPLCNLLEGCTLQAAWPSLRLATTTDQSRTLENFEVFGYRRRGDRKWLREFLDGEFSSRQPRQDGTPGGIGQSRKCRTQVVGHVIYPYG